VGSVPARRRTGVAKQEVVSSLLGSYKFLRRLHIALSANRRSIRRIIATRISASVVSKPLVASHPIVALGSGARALYLMARQHPKALGPGRLFPSCAAAPGVLDSCMIRPDHPSSSPPEPSVACRVLPDASQAQEPPAGPVAYPLPLSVWRCSSGEPRAPSISPVGPTCRRRLRPFLPLASVVPTVPFSVIFRLLTLTQEAVSARSLQ
jgi:hypothetical protein